MGSLGKELLLSLLLVLTAWTTTNDATEIKAIQILETTDGEDGSRVLQTIEHHPGGPSLQEILMSDQTKHLPLLVFSVTGKTRGGKSFLLNLMHKYLQVEGSDNWKRGQVPNVFEWKEGTDSTTRGLWISPTIFRRQNEEGTEVGIILMDSQGLFDGEITGGESVAMSGVSTILSHVQMFNMKEDITTNDLEHIMLHLVPDLPNQKSGNTTGTSLMFVIRDFIGGKKSGFGLTNGNKYINEEQNRGTEEYRSMWEEHRKVFSKIECVLLPHPGLRVLTEDFTRSPNLNELSASFISEIDNFFKQLFDPKNLIPYKDPLTGHKIRDLLEKINGKKADINLSYYNMHLNRMNDENWQQLIVEFENKLKLAESLHNANFLVNEIVSKSKFKGPTAKQQTSKLKKKLQQITNERVKLTIAEKYNHSLRHDAPKESHGIIWPILSPLMDEIILGEEKQTVRNDIIKDLAIAYYDVLRRHKDEEFKNSCDKASSQAFYNQLVALKKPGELNLFTIAEIENNRDFESTSTNLSSLNAVLLKERLQFGEYIDKILLRNMFKVKSYFVEYYAASLKESDIINQNGALWLEVKHKLDNLVFETESEQSETINGIVKEIAKVYYERLRKKQVDEMERKWDQMDNTQFHREFDKYSNSIAMIDLVSQLLPQFNGFESEDVAEIWKNEKTQLEVYLSLSIYKGLKLRGLEKEANGFWDKFGEKIVKVLGNIIVNAIKKAAGLPTANGNNLWN